MEYKAKQSLLSRNDVDMNVQDLEGNTPLHIALSSDQTSDNEILALVINKDIETNLKNNRGETLLHVAVLTGRRDVLKTLARVVVNLLFFFQITTYTYSSSQKRKRYIQPKQAHSASSCFQSAKNVWRRTFL